jgi:chemotaxis regulatin CheY-phosphate phosphatase CheZ
MESGQESVIAQLGHLTRKLHEALRELGYDQLLQDTAKAYTRRARSSGLRRNHD